MAKGNYKIPFYKGNMLGYVDYFMEKNDEVEWIDNYVFTTTMTIGDYGRGRSSISIYMRDENGKEYTMFISDFMEVVTIKGIENGKFSGEFTFCKKGQNYGLQLTASELEGV